MPDSALVAPASSRYPILQPTSTGEMQEIMNANVGPHGFSLGDLDRIKVPAGGATSWTVTTLDGDSMVKEFEGIIVAWRVARAYWKISLNEGGGQRPPDCVSKDGFRGVGEPGGDCQKCPLAKFGTSGKGAGQACKMVRENLILMPDSTVPVLLRVPPTSLRPAQRYFLRLMSARVPSWGVITRFRLETASNKQGTQYSRIIFELAGQLSAGEREIMRAYHGKMTGALEGADVAQDFGDDLSPAEEASTNDIPF
jgi:hypothetical protein